MKRVLRTLVALPLVVLVLIAIPALLVSVASANDNVTSAVEQHGPPPPRPPHHGTVPPPTPRPIPPAPVPPRPLPPAPTATPASTPIPQESLLIGGQIIIKVIGDRLSATIYAFTEDGRLYRSDLDGRAWYLVNSAPEVDDFVMSAADPNVLYSGAGINCSNPTATIAPMYKSWDGGETWEEVATGVNMRPLLASQFDSQTLFAADCSTVYLTQDGGATWTPRPTAAADNLWNTYVPEAMASGSLVGSPRPAQPHWDQLYGIGNSTQDEGVVVFTGDQGETWANITNAAQPPKGEKAIEASLYDGGQIWIVDGKGVWTTSDYGVNWKYWTNGLKQLTRAYSAPLNDVTYTYNGRLYLATDVGLYMMKTPGAAWEKVEDTGFDQETLLSFLITESNPRKLWINGEDGVYSIGVDLED